MSPSPYGEDFLPSDDETGSTIDSDTDSLFDDSDDETDATSVAETDSDTDDDASLFEDEVRHPPEHYLAEAAKVDVTRLRQRRYDPKTRKALDWVKEHHDQYEQYLSQFYQELSLC